MQKRYRNDIPRVSEQLSYVLCTKLHSPVAWTRKVVVTTCQNSVEDHDMFHSFI